MSKWVKVDVMFNNGYDMCDLCVWYYGKDGWNVSKDQERRKGNRMDFYTVPDLQDSDTSGRVLFINESSPKKSKRVSFCLHHT